MAIRINDTAGCGDLVFNFEHGKTAIEMTLHASMDTSFQCAKEGVHWMAAVDNPINQQTIYPYTNKQIYDVLVANLDKTYQYNLAKIKEFFKIEE
jgi:hypothetical protein